MTVVLEVWSLGQWSLPHLGTDEKWPPPAPSQILTAESNTLGQGLAAGALARGRTQKREDPLGLTAHPSSPQVHPRDILLQPRGSLTFHPVHKPHIRSMRGQSRKRNQKSPGQAPKMKYKKTEAQRRPVPCPDSLTESVAMQDRPHRPLRPASMPSLRGRSQDVAKTRAPMKFRDAELHCVPGPLLPHPPPQHQCQKQNTAELTVPYRPGVMGAVGAGGWV